MEQLLNNYLSDLVVEYHKLQNFHWYVKGKDFFQAHAKLEELYDGVNEAIDAVAENLLMIGGHPLASLKDFLAHSKIEEVPAQYVSSSVVFESVLKDFEYLLASSKAIKKAADEKEEYLISGLMDEYIGQYSKSIWMIKQMMAD